MKALLLSLTVALVACRAARQQVDTGAAPGTFVITAEQIEKSGANTAWQVLKQKAPMFSTQEDRNGQPASLRRRGRSSLYLDDSPMVFLDGVRVPDFRALDSIEAQSIAAIFIYDGVEGTTHFGTNAGTGVIYIKTKDGSHT